VQTLDTGTEYFLGENCNVLRPGATEFAKSFAWAFDVGLNGIAQRIRLGKFARFYYDRRYNKACETVHSYLDPIVQRAIARNRTSPQEKSSETKVDDGRYIFLDALTKEDVSPTEIQDQVLNIRKFKLPITSPG
jgi:hypothetical protein